MGPVVARGCFETLHFKQKSTFFNRLYFATSLMALVKIMNMAFNADNFPWNQEILALGVPPVRLGLSSFLACLRSSVRACALRGARTFVP